MVATMQSRRTRVSRRAIVAALALYALLVQAFLAGFAPAKAAHELSAATAILCSHEASGGSPQHMPLAHEQGCCLAACFAAALAGPALLPSAAAAWPSREAESLVWAMAAIAPGARPASSPVNARGPPAA
jgi:hypothetical protein